MSVTALDDLFAEFLAGLRPSARALLAASHHLNAEPRKMLELNQLLALVPISKATLYRLTDAGRFPRAEMVGGRRLWFADEVAHWQRDLERTGRPMPGRNSPRPPGRPRK